MPEPDLPLQLGRNVELILLWLPEIQAVLLVLRALAHASQPSSSPFLLAQSMPPGVRLLGVRPETGQTLAEDQSPDSGRVWASAGHRAPHHGKGKRRASPVLPSVKLGPRPADVPCHMSVVWISSPATTVPKHELHSFPLSPWVPFLLPHRSL